MKNLNSHLKYALTDPIVHIYDSFIWGFRRAVFERETMYKNIITGGYPLNWPFIMDNGSGEPGVVAFMEDAEGDIFQINYLPDKVMEIQSDSYPTMLMTKQELKLLNTMLIASNMLWRKLDPYWNEETWVGWEHLATQPETK